MDKTAQIEYFEGLLTRHGANYKALDWNSPESQRLRYRVLKEILVYGRKAAGISLLDLGCGLGDLFGFLKAEGSLQRHHISYAGYDISPKLIECACRRYPGGEFEVKDILEDRYVKSFDYVFCSGVFNIRTTEKEEHLDYVREMLFRMYDLCSCGVAVNFLSEGGLPARNQEEPESGPYFYFDPEKLLNVARFICTRQVLRHDYHPGDFTLYLLK